MGHPRNRRIAREHAHGPGTGFDVIAKLDGGTKLEVINVDADGWDADGWAHVSTVDRGIEGWIAERLLTDTNT
ncbi:SH3 domain-containing protein [Octadecabacter antarcticus]|uniref:SH3 domain-containing protein n=1 Tax=Octadecabacter antarcticus TaxID=1217908 RepID=UPI0011818C34